MTEIHISALVVTYRRPKELAVCLESLSTQTQPPQEIIVIDNGAFAGDEAKKVCEAANHEGIEILYFESLINSLPASRNRGVRECNGEFIALIDDDVRVKPTFLEEIFKAYKEHPDAVAVQGYIKPGERALWRERLQRFFGLYNLRPDSCKVLPSITTTYPLTLSNTVSCQWISGSNQVYRRSVLQEILWDEGLLKYADGEDLDHSYRVYKKYPGKLFITPRAEVIHDEVSTGRAVGYELITMREVYGWYLFKKLFPNSPSAFMAYLWSRIGKFVLTVAVALFDRRADAWKEVHSVLGAYWFVIKNNGLFGNGDLRKFHEKFNLLS